MSVVGLDLFGVADGLWSLEPLAGQWFELLARQLLYAGCVALVVALPARWLGRRYPALAHGLWSLVLIRLLMPPDLASSFSLRGLWQQATRSTPTAVDASGPVAPLHLLPWTEHLGGAPAMPATTADTMVYSLIFLGWATLALCLLLAGFYRRRIYLRHLQRPVDDPVVLDRLDAWRRRLGIRRAVELWTGSAEQVPFTLGIRRPRIFVPQRLLALAAKRRQASDDRDADVDLLEAVLGHELAHIVHRDDAWLQLQRWLLAAYLFFPPLWLACRRMQDARERLADAAAVATGLVSPRDYALALLRVHQLQLNRSETVSALGPDPRRLVVRIRSILDLPASAAAHSAPHRRLFTGPLVGLPLAALCGLLILPMAAVRDAAADNGGDEPPPVQASADPQTPHPASAAATDTASAAATDTAPPLSLLHPLSGARLTAPFGMWRSPFKQTTDHHNGLDLAHPRGSLITAPADGIVAAAETDLERIGDYGVVLTIDHGNRLETIYAHLDNVLVEIGEKVTAGQPIATVGLTGKTTGPHLHFEVRQDGEPLDPAPLLDDDC